MTPDGYEPRDDLGEQAVNDLVMRGATLGGYGPALEQMLAEAFDRGVEASARLDETICSRLGVRSLADKIRALKGGGR